MKYLEVSPTDSIPAVRTFEGGIGFSFCGISRCKLDLERLFEGARSSSNLGASLGISAEGDAIEIASVFLRVAHKCRWPKSAICVVVVVRKSKLESYLWI